MKRRRPLHAKSAARRAGPATEVVLDIAQIGARGDGVAAGAAGPVYVPFTLPGEQVRARVSGERGELLSVERASGERVDAPCPHFGRCGGCQLQHWSEPAALAWKRDELVRALARRGIEADVEPAVRAWGEGRRRATFHAQRVNGGLRFGFVERGGARIEPVQVCPILAPALAGALPTLCALADALAPPHKPIALACLATEAGLDVAIEGAGSADDFDLRRREAAARLAEAHDLARLSFGAEPFVTRREPFVTLGPARVTPPPGGFLQATLEGERTLARLVCNAVGDAARIADLFSGVGTFALRLAAGADVHAIEGEADMLAALKQAGDHASGLRAVTVERRDLLREPLAATELKRFEAVVFDPPRAGAKLQAEQIAASKVARIAAVSCDPATFARDVRILIDGGFTLKRATPVDQFRWTPHIEVVGALER